MLSVRSTTVHLAFVLALAAAALPAQAGCGKYGGWGIGVTQGIATFMSEKATHQSMEKAGAKQTGTMKTTCDSGNILYVTCQSSARACKP